MADETVMFPVVVVPPLVVLMVTLEPLFSAVLILATLIVVVVSFAVGSKLTGPGSPLPDCVIFALVPVMLMSSGSSNQVPALPL